MEAYYREQGKTVERRGNALVVGPPEGSEWAFTTLSADPHEELRQERLDEFLPRANWQNARCVC